MLINALMSQLNQAAPVKPLSCCDPKTSETKTHCFLWRRRPHRRSEGSREGGSGTFRVFSAQDFLKRANADRFSQPSIAVPKIAQEDPPQAVRIFSCVSSSLVCAPLNASLSSSSATFGEAGRPGRLRPEQGAPAAPVRKMQSPGLLLPPRAIKVQRLRRLSLCPFPPHVLTPSHLSPSLVPSCPTTCRNRLSLLRSNGLSWQIHRRPQPPSLSVSADYLAFGVRWLSVYRDAPFISQPMRRVVM